MTDLQIFMKAPADASAEELKAYLDEACGDDAALRSRVESLLQADASAGRFMSAPCTLLDEESSSPVIDRYKLLQEIGEGGFGVVYMADQLEPVKRRVAIKVVREGMATRPIIARFEAERQALAMMDHPNIARVLDAGATAEKRPYFVMELIKGVPITTYCEQENLPVTRRLKLFIQVCRAVQHAHIKGIIHRDLKPSNVLVTLKDGEPVPKVIDFGIAKALDQRLTEKTLFTRYDQMIGTPSYMSPEQAALSGVDVDTRSDIYALGVLLYELLTGATPFDLETLQRAAFDEMRRIIREVDPPKPSTRLSRALAAASKDRPQTEAGETTLAARRHRRMTETVALLRGDLDWIVMRCLEKDRNRRYETANGLLMDIERHLGDEPVLARPPTPWYRAQKLAKRNKLVFGSAAAVFLALLIGLGTALWGLSEANDQRDIAQRESVEARKARHLADRQVYFMHLANAGKALLGKDYLEKNYARARVELDACAQGQRGWEWQFLENRYRTILPMELPARGTPHYSQDGTRLFAIHDDKPCIWDLTSEAGSATLLSHENKLVNLALSPDDQWLVGIDTLGSLVLWDLQTLEKTWEVDSDDDIWIRDQHQIKRLAFSPDSSLIATPTGTGKVSVYHRVDGALKFSISSSNSSFRKVMFSLPAGRWLACDANPSVIIDVSSEAIVKSFPMGERVPTFSPDGRLIATGNPAKNSITLWEWDGKQLNAQRSWPAADSSRFFDLSFLADGSQIVSLQGAHVMVWDVETQENVGAYHHGDLCRQMTMNPMGNEVAVSADDRILLWHYRASENVLVINPHNNPSWLVVFSPDGQKIAVGSHRGQYRLSSDYGERGGDVIILEAESGKTITEIPGPIYGFAWVPDPDSGQIVVARDQERAHEIIDAKTGAFIRKLTGPSGGAKPFIDQSGRILASVGKVETGQSDVPPSRRERIFRMWNLKSGLLHDESLVTSDLRSVSLDFQGRRLAMFDWENVTLWDTQVRRVTHTLATPGRLVTTLIFTDDGNELYVGSNRSQLTRFDIQSQQVDKHFNGHGGAITGIALSPDETQMVSSDLNGGVIIWDTESALPLVVLSDAIEGASNACSVDWSPDNKRIAVGRMGGIVEIWKLPTERHIETAERWERSVSTVGGAHE